MDQKYLSSAYGNAGSFYRTVVECDVHKKRICKRFFELFGVAGRNWMNTEYSFVISYFQLHMEESWI